MIPKPFDNGEGAERVSNRRGTEWGEGGGTEGKVTYYRRGCAEEETDLKGIRCRVADSRSVAEKNDRSDDERNQHDVIQGINKMQKERTRLLRIDHICAKGSAVELDLEGRGGRGDGGN